MAYTYEQVFAADPSNPSNVAQNASITIFAPGDSSMTPLTITDPDGQPLNNPIPVNANGFGSAFAHATLDRVAWAGGGFTGFFTSYEGMKGEAVAAREAAEQAAATAGVDAAAVATAAIGTATDEAAAAAASAATAASNASASATAAANSAALVGAPADSAIAAAINGSATATKTALNATIATAVPAAVGPIVPPLVEAQVPPLVAEAIAADPTVAAAAADAVTADIAGRSLVESTDARIPQNIGTITGYKEVTVTADGYVISGVLDDGTLYNFFDTANPARTADPLVVPGYRNIVFDKTKTYVLEADKTDGAKYFHKLSVSVLDIPETAIARVAAVASFGDSMTGDHASTGTSVGAYLGTALDLPAFQGGVPGQSSTEAAFRAGGLEMWGSVTGGTIPTSGTVGVTITVPTGTWISGSAWTFPASAILEDGTEIPGSLVKAIGNTWTFQATSLSVAKAAPREVKFVSNEGTENKGRAIIFRAGRNNPAADTATVVRDYKAVRDWVYATQARPRFLALPLYNPSDAPVGSSIYNSYTATNAAIAEECGPDFYDLRRWLIKYGLSAAGITPTSQDTADIAQDIVPSSLRYNNGADTTHLTTAGRIVEAVQIANVIKSKGWFNS